MTITDLLNDLTDASNISDHNHVMLNVAGRWTGIKAVYVEDDGTIFIESVD